MKTDDYRHFKAAVLYWWNHDPEPFNPPVWVCKLVHMVERRTLLKFNYSTGEWMIRRGKGERE